MTSPAGTGWDHVQSLKEVVRHVAYRTSLTAILDWRRRRRGLATSHLRPGTAADRFRAVYEAGAWVASPGQSSRSGIGSELAATSEVRRRLPALLAELGCRRLVDVGCGDWHWMSELSLPCEYVGIDVVPEVIERNRRFERPGVSFRLADAVSQPLPDGEVALCREVLFHLSIADGLAVLRNVAASSRWLLATTDRDIWFNSDIRSGDYRRINLERRPYRLRPPRQAIRDDAVSRGRVLALWPASDLPTPSAPPGGTPDAATRSSARAR